MADQVLQAGSVLAAFQRNQKMREAVGKYAADIHWLQHGEGSDQEITEVLDELVMRAPLVEAILDSVGEVAYRDESSYAHPGQAYLGYRTPCLRALGRLGDQQLIASIRSPGPSLSAVRFHPWVWDAAGALWNGGHHRQAVSAAAGVIAAQTQALLGRDDIADQDLMAQAFSLSDPADGAPRLRVAPSMTSKSGKALQQGALNFAQGVFGYIRNPATHETGEWDEQEALEKLTALSVLARLIAGATVVRIGDEPAK